MRFPLGITAGVVAQGLYSGTLTYPVIEANLMAGVGYEHEAGAGWALRAGLYAGGRLHAWNSFRYVAMLAIS